MNSNKKPVRKILPIIWSLLIITCAILFVYAPFIYFVVCLLIASLFMGIITLLIRTESRYNHFINYMSTIFGTLVGVFLAIYVTQLETQKSQLLTTGDILQSAKNDIYSCNLNTQDILKNITDTNGSKNYKNIRIYPKYKPNTLTEILKMEIVLERISHRTLEKLSIMSSEMSAIYDFLFDKNDNYQEFLDKGKLYSANLGTSFSILKHELQYLQDSISFETLDSLVIVDSTRYAEAKISFGKSLP